MNYFANLAGMAGTKQEKKQTATTVPDWELARHGIQLVLNNKYEDAENVFQNRGNSIHLATGYCYMVFMNAVMSFEKDSLDKATETIKELESRCAYNLGWFKTVKNMVFGTKESSYDLMEQQIILADCHLCLAFLNMIKQDSTAGFMKGGWILKKAWSLYLSCYNNLSGDYKKCFGSDITLPGVRSRISHSKSAADSFYGRRTDSDSRFGDQKLGKNISTSPSKTGMAEKASIYGNPGSKDTSIGSPDVEDDMYLHHFAVPDVAAQKAMMCSFGHSPADINRLTRAVCFGYGLFHLCVSLLPPTILRLIQLLGFVGDRDVGLRALEMAKHGPDMRAPLATLALLWYHTIIKPVFAVCPEEINHAIKTAESIVEMSKEEFNNSAIFFFFRGRIHRLKNEVNAAVSVYTSAVSLSGQRELSLLCLHEVGWCRLIQLDFNAALRAFGQLKEQSRWSKLFYYYLTAVCFGCVNEMGNVVQLSTTIRNRQKSRLSQLDQLILQRTEFLMPTQTPHFYRLLAYEMLYMWDSMPGREGIQSMLNDIDTINKSPVSKQIIEPMIGLSSLLAGVCLSILGKNLEAIQKLSIVRSIRLPHEKAFSATDVHISAFSLYEIGMIAIRLKKWNDAKHILDSCLSFYSEYDFEHRLKMKVNAALRSIPPDKLSDEGSSKPLNVSLDLPKEQQQTPSNIPSSISRKTE